MRGEAAGGGGREDIQINNDNIIMNSVGSKTCGCAVRGAGCGESVRGRRSSVQRYQASSPRAPAATTRHHPP